MTTASTTPRILVIDDDNDLRYSLKRVLSSRQYEVLEAASGEEGLTMAQNHSPHVILLDNRMGGISGMEALQHLRGINPNAMIILMTAYGTTQTTIEAMKFGAFDYIMKPFDLKKIITITELAVAASKDLDKVVKEERETVLSKEDFEGGIVGSSSAMQEVFKMIGQVAASDVTVMITGESGTGKELIARAIYQNSLRAHKPYIAVNCAAIPESLIESELFGHEKGSFTGATNQRIGKFELCDGGTIFLDEIGDMALATQTKILRALQEGEIQRVGSSETIKVKVRMLAATNKPLEDMVKDKTFREDLYYRLNVVRIQLPPLRERRDDVPQLIDFVLKRLAKESKAGAKTISPEVLDLLANYDWPGNVRELENLIYRSAVIAQGEMILLKDLPQEVVQSLGGLKKVHHDKSTTNCGEKSIRAHSLDVETLIGKAVPDPNESFYKELRKKHKSNILEHSERTLIALVLKDCKGKQVNAAEILGITRATLRKRIDQYDL